MTKRETQLLSAVARKRGDGQAASASAYLRATAPITPHVFCGTVLAIDPSIAACGWAVLDAKGNRLASGTWHPSGAKEAIHRFDQLHDFIRKLVHEHGVTVAVVEVPSAHHSTINRKAADINKITYGMAVGAVAAAARGAGAVVRRVEVGEWKGRAKKSYTAMLMRSRFGVPDAGDNETDALGLGDWWLAMQRGNGLARSATGEVRP